MEAASRDRETPIESAAEHRAMVFIDGSNWYHGLRRNGVRSSLLDYRKVAGKLAMGRPVRSVRYYIGKAVRGTRSEMGQHRFLAALREQGVEVVLGKVQRNSLSSGEQAKRERLRGLLRDRADEVPGEVSEAIRDFLVPAWTEVEKQVDTAISADLVDLAHRGEYEVAYLLSADSDFIPAVRIVRLSSDTNFYAFGGHELLRTRRVVGASVRAGERGLGGSRCGSRQRSGEWRWGAARAAGAGW